MPQGLYHLIFFFRSPDDFSGNESRWSLFYGIDANDGVLTCVWGSHGIVTLPESYPAGTYFPWLPIRLPLSVMRSNSINTASSTRSVNSSMINDPCNGFSFFFGKTQFMIDDQLDSHSPAHTLFGWRGNGLIISIGMQRVAIVIDGIQSL